MKLKRDLRQKALILFAFGVERYDRLAEIILNNRSHKYIITMKSEIRYYVNDTSTAKYTDIIY